MTSIARTNAAPGPAEPMGFVAREIDRVEAALREPDILPCRYAKLYAINQALGWVLEPDGFRSPYSWVTDTPAGSEDCSAHIRPPSS